MTQIIDLEHNASHRAEKPRNEASLTSGNTTVEKSGGRGGGGCRMELPLKESMSQKRKLQLHEPRGSEAKKVILSR